MNKENKGYKRKVALKTDKSSNVLYDRNANILQTYFEGFFIFMHLLYLETIPAKQSLYCFSTILRPAPLLLRFFVAK